MLTAIDSTEWPSTPISDDIKQKITLLFKLVESKESTVGFRLASDVYTKDARIVTPHSKATGTAEILTCRDHVWEGVQSRKHDITKVYASDADGMDIMLLGTLTTVKNDGSIAKGGLVARLVFEGNVEDKGGLHGGGVKVKFYQAGAF